MQYLKKTKKLLAWLLAAAVIVTAVPQMPLVANAAEMDMGAEDGTQQAPEESGGADADSSKEKEPEETEMDSPEDTEPEEAGSDTDVSEDKESEDKVSDSSEEESGEESVPETPETEEDAESEGTESEKPQDGDAEEKPAEETTIEDPETAGISGNDLGEAAVYAEGVEDTDYGTPLYSGTGAEGSTIEWTIYEGGKLVVTGEGEIKTSSSVPWYQYRDVITSAQINVSGMKNAAYLFQACSNLTTLDVSGWDTSSVTDMYGMFFDCSSLTTLDVSGWDTGNVTRMCFMFSGCSNLTALDVSGWNISSVTDMWQMFEDCSSLTALDVSGWNTSSVTGMASMFSGCSSLTALDLSGWDTSNVTSMYGVFSGCSSLTALNVSGPNTSNVTDMREVFRGCSSLTALDVSGWNTSSVREMCRLFEGCSSLTELNVRGWDISSVINMDDMFDYCSSLTALDLSSWNADNASGMDRMFRYSALEEIRTPYNVRESVLLPATTGSTKWRLPDGTAVTKLPVGIAESITITSQYVAISFSGDNFILKDGEGQDIVSKALLVKKGTKDVVTFIIEPVEQQEGYTFKLSGSSSVDIRNGAERYRYVLSPGNASEGYVRDIEIQVETTPAESSRIDFDYYEYAIESYVVANGDYISEENPGSVEVSNAYNTVVYVKPAESDEIIHPTLEIGYRYSGSRVIPYLTDPFVMSDKEKEMVQRGYYIFDMGVVSQNEEVRLWYKTMYQARFIMDGLPEDVRVQVSYDGTSNYTTLSNNTDTIFVEKSSDWLEIYVDFDTETHPEYKWCMPELSVDASIEVSGEKRGTSWKIRNYEFDFVTVRISLEPGVIPLSYVESEVQDLRVESSHVRLSEDRKALKAYGGDDFSLSFALAEGISLTGAYFVTYWGEAVELEYTETDGRYTVGYTFENGYELGTNTKIVLSTKDALDRYSLSGLNSQCTITLNKPKNGYMYNGRAIEPEVRSVTFSTTTAAGKKIKETLDEKDYVVSYANNIDAGTATVTITAAEDSGRYKGSCSTTFQISKARELGVYGVDETGACRLPVDAEKAGTVQQADLSDLFEINSPYEKNITPIWCGLRYSSLGEILKESPTFSGSMMTYSLMDNLTKSSQPAKITVEAAFANYESIPLDLVLLPVERKDLVLGGTVTARDQIYDGMPIAFEATDLYVVSVAGQKPEDAAAVMAQIQDDLTFQYTGTGDTIYDSLIPPVDVGTYQVSVAVSTENIDYRSEYLKAGTFTISKRAAAITVKDTKLYRDDSAPVQFDYEVSGDGLAEGDTISTEPVLACPALDMTKAGEYPLNIDVTGVCIRNEEARDVTANYSISGVNGTLSVQEPEPGSYSVVFNLSGKGDSIKRSGIESGSLITKPRDPSAEGYVFLGWYSDEAFAKLWDFDTDIIQGDLVLYAGWSKNLTENDGMTLYVRNILPQTYTGKAIQPVITVYAADGRTLLKKNKDYSIAYKNNVDADTKKFKDQDVIPDGGIGASLTDDSRGFNSKLAYVVVTGKGNYTGKVYINFHINPADISTAGSAASDFTLKYTEQFEEKPGKTAAVVTKLKSKKATLKYGKDYTLTVTNVVDDTPVTLTSKGQLPLNAGTYRLTIEGIDNYTGSIDKELYVASKAQLLKNAKVTCTGTISDVTKEQLEAGIEPQNLQVSMSGTTLTRDVDYEVACSNNYAVGTATVTVKGKGSYFGSKSITFKIKGKTFKEKEFETIALQDMTYNGTALTQNDVRLKMLSGSELAYGTDYSISYKNNIKKGKATMTFTANPKSGYSGSFKKTFKIVAAGLDSDEVTVDGAAKQDLKWTLSESVPYQKGGATPGSKLTLRLRANGTALTMGKDYTVKYKNNAEVSTGKAYMTLTGKGNFTGTMTVLFNIEKASLAELYKEKRVTVASKAVRATFSYRRVDDDPEGELKDPDYEFKPAVTVKDGKKALKLGEDYKIEYYENDRSTLERGSGKPYVKVTGIGNYSKTSSEEDESFNVPLSIYQYSISNSKIYIVYEEDEFTYTGGQIIPKIAAVYYGNASDISKAKRNGETNEAILTTEKPEKEPGEPDPDYEYGLTKLSEYKEGIGGDYIISSYGANKLKGKTGKVTIRGIYNYSGSATSTFTIKPKEIYSLIQGEDDEESDE